MNKYVKEYRSCGTIKDTAINLGESMEIVRRELINAGEISIDNSIRKAREMFARGISPQEIAETLQMSKKTVMRILPRQKPKPSPWTAEEDRKIIQEGVTELPNRSKQAVSIRRTRLKKKYGEK